MIIIIPIVILFIYFYIKKHFKVLKLGALSLFTGGVKTGKSTSSVYFAIRCYKQNKRKVKIKNFFNKVFGKPLIEEPLLYSNIPLAVPYVPLTYDLITRQKRFRFGSVVYINEASLLADSQLIQDKELNTQLLLFAKLIGHETKGGMLILDTQSVADVHYSFKRSFSNYFYIHHLTKWIPFFLVAYVQEVRYSEDGSVISVSLNDAEETLKRVIIPKSVWRKFDAFCYSSLTDNLPCVDNIQKADSLKIKKLLSFRKSLNLEVNSNEKKDC